jgi:hypothetical protein
VQHIYSHAHLPVFRNNSIIVGVSGGLVCAHLPQSRMWYVVCAASAVCPQLPQLVCVLCCFAGYKTRIVFR